MQMITDLVINVDSEISKFFIEEATHGKNRGTMTYVPVNVLLEILRKEQINTDDKIRQQLRQLLAQQLLIKNPKVKRFILLESDYALNIIGKLQFYVMVLPSNIDLIKQSLSDYPDEGESMYQPILSLKKQI